jgi:hypothetical protein
VDPQATQKISREELEMVLKGTKSGTRAAVRSAPDLEDQGYPGPRDDAPQEMIPIDSAGFEDFERATLPTASTSVVPSTVHAPPDARPSAPRVVAKWRAAWRRIQMKTTRWRRIQMTPRMALIGGTVAIVVVTLSAIFGFFAARGILGLK